MEAHVCAYGKKIGKFNNILRFRALFDTYFRVMFFLKIREVRWRVSIDLFLNVCGETAYLARFIEL